MNFAVVASLMITFLILSGLAVYAWQHRTVSGTRGFFWFSITIALWVLGAVLAAFSKTPEQAAFWMFKGRMVGLAMSPVGLLCFVLDYTGRQGWLTRRRLGLLLVIPAATLIVSWFFSEALVIDPVFIKNGPFMFYQSAVFGWWNWIHLTYTFGLVFISLGMIVQYAFQIQQFYRTRAVFLLAGGLIPLITALLTSVVFMADLFHDTIALSFSLAGVLWAWALFRFRFISVNPVAHNVILASMLDPIIVLNSRLQVVDFNPAAARLLKLTDETIGKPADEALTAHPGLLTLIANPTSETQETRLSGTRGEHYYDARLSPLISQNKSEYNGLLIALREITRLKESQQAEHEQRLMAEALHDTAAALNSTLATEDVIQRIFENVGRVVQHDAANILLIDEEMHVTRLLHSSERGKKRDTLQEITIVATNGDAREIPLFARMLFSGDPVVIPDTHKDPDWVAVETQEWVCSYIGIPISIRGQAMGFLNLYSAALNQYSEKQVKQLLPFTHQAAAALENAGLFEESTWLANHDPLTRLCNRRHFFTVAEQEVERAQRYNHHLSLIMLDIDRFKLVNDTHGHLAGDKVLSEIASLCEESIRKVDIAARYGGEEFVLLLPETTQARAFEIAERVRLTTASHRFRISDSETVSVTLSLGVASLRKGDTNIEALIQRADEALYSVKDGGRNQTAVSAGDQAQP